MKQTQELKTLGDYRKAVHDPLFPLSLYPKRKSGSPYDALQIALRCGSDLIRISPLASLPEENWWCQIYVCGTAYKYRNQHLFDCIGLMEFVNTYKEFQSFEKLFSSWPKRADMNISFFTFAGLSYLEAAFSFVREFGGDIILALHKSYKKYRKEGNILYWNPMKFLSETPTVDDLEINPEPDIIIKTWLGDIVKGTQKWIQENNISPFNVKAEFNKINKQLEYEWNAWKKPKAPDMVDLSKPLPLTKWAVIFGVSYNTMRNWQKNKKYPFEKISERKWALPINKIPAEYRIPYNKHTSK